MNSNAIMRNVILGQCAGMLSMLVFQNGFMLAFLSYREMSSANILFLLALPQLMFFLCLLPAAYLSDQVGKKKLGVFGQILSVLGFLILLLSSLFSIQSEWGMFIGIALFGLGTATFASNWFALLKPIVPEEIRGRFFGKMRASWQTSAIVFTFLSTLVLAKNSSSAVYHSIIASIIIFLIIRLFLYLKIPELEHNTEKLSFVSSLRFMLKIPGYLQFCCYLFLLMLFVGGVPWMLNLLEKQYLGFTDNELVLMGNFLAIGSLAGFYFGGKIVDHWGTRPVFLLIHFLFGSVLFLFAVRSWIPFPLMITLGFLTSIYGFCLAASSIASAAEMMLLIPKENVSLTTALNTCMTAGGSALSGILAGKILDFEILSKQWQMWGHTMNEYDTILLGSAMMVMLLVVTLGLIPSVTGQRQMFPVNRV
ncbi:MAG: MFS transporter [SAR324 cluster bacterium]|nr:MFS transporter [SAR324 cluster bacterium]